MCDVTLAAYLFMDEAMKEVREKAGDVVMKEKNIKWKVHWLMFADDTVLLDDSEEKL